MSTTAQRKLLDAQERVRFVKKLEQACEFLNNIKSNLPNGSSEKESLSLIKDALFFVCVRQLDGFRSFLKSIPHDNPKPPVKRRKT
jgi:hypothetical protein